MMENSVLNNLKRGEQLVEMQECTLHGMDVIEVTLYKCVSFLGFRKIKTYTFPFYFTSKEVVEKFLKFNNYFKIVNDHLRWDSSVHCFALSIKNCRIAHMVDEYKKNDTHKYTHCSLTFKGIWGGELNDTSDMYPSSMSNNYDFMKFLDSCNISIKKEKTYTFKMIENC